MRRRRRGQIAFRFYVLLFVALCLLGYGVYVAVDSLVQRTAIIESGEDLGRQYKAQAVIVRDEALTDAEGVSKVDYFAEEGALVFKGNKIAEVYTTGFSQTDSNKLLNVRTEIKEHLKTLLASNYNDAQLDRLDEQVWEYAREFELIVHGDARGNLLNLESQLQQSLERRQNYLKLKYITDQSLVSLYDTEAQLVKKMQSWTKTHWADSDCIVSFYTDGYESMLSVDKFDQISAAAVRSVLNGEAPALTTAQRGRSAVFRQVQPNGWHLLLLSYDSNWNPIDGTTYKVQLDGFDDQIIDAVVTSSTRSGNEILVRLRVSGSVRSVLNVRTTNAQIGEQYVSGLKVPRNALKDQGGWGVVKVDEGGIFVPVNIVEMNDQYVIIQSLAAGALKVGERVRVF